MTNQPNEPNTPADRARAFRQRAEEKLSATRTENLDALSLNQSRQLLHELQVHQIELEMQNDELRRIQATLETTRARYFDLYDLAPVGYVTLSDQGMILQANLRIATLLGVSRSTLVNQPLSHFVLPEDQDQYYRSRRNLFANGDPQVFELRVRRHTTGAVLWVRLEMTLGQAGESPAQVCRATVSDITEQKLAQAALDQTLALNQKILEMTPSLVYIFDLAAQQNRFVNHSLASALGFPPEQAAQIGSVFMPNDVHPDDADALRVREKLVWVATASDGDIASREYRVRDVNGAWCWIGTREMIFSRASDGTPTEIMGMGQDITERKQMEATLHTRVLLSEFADTHTLDELLQKTLDEAETLTGSQIGFYHFVDADQKILHLQTWSTNTLQKMCTAEGKGRHYDVDLAGVWTDCVQTRQPVIHNDYARLTHRKGLPEGHAPVVRELVVPVLRGDLIVAILGMGNKPTAYDLKDVETVSQLASLAWDIVLRKRAEEALRHANLHLEEQLGELHNLHDQLREQAVRDPLTQLYNRRYLNETLPREIALAHRRAYAIGVLMLDIDHFKRINDTYGHLAGDETLVAVARTLTQCLRASDLICRYGGEEFLCLLVNTTKEIALQRAEQVCAAIADLTIVAAQPTARVTVSIGVALLPPHGNDMIAILKAADAAMYDAKADGRNRVRLADET